MCRVVGTQYWSLRLHAGILLLFGPGFERIRKTQDKAKQRKQKREANEDPDPPPADTMMPTVLSEGNPVPVLHTLVGLPEASEVAGP